MSEHQKATDIYICFRSYNAAQQDAAVETVMSRYNAECVNVGTFFVTGQRSNTYEVPGVVDQLMCLRLEAELSRVLGQAVTVTTRFEETDVGRFLT